MTRRHPSAATPTPPALDADRAREALQGSKLQGEEEPSALPDETLLRELEANLPREERRVTDTAVGLPPGPPEADQGAERTTEYRTPESRAAVVPPQLQAHIGRLEAEAHAATSARRSAVLFYDLGRIAETLGDKAGALGHFRSAFERYPGLTVNLRALGRLLAANGDHAGCVHVLEAELQGAPSGRERAAILTQRALVRWKQLGDVSGALQDLQRVLDIDPDDPAGLLLAELHEHLGRHRDAQRVLSRRAKACEQPELRSTLLCDMARLAELPADREAETSTPPGTSSADVEVMAGYRNALNAAPSNTHALRSLLRTARAAGDYPAVAKLCKTLSAFEPDAVAAASLWEAARLYAHRLRNTDLAIESLQLATERAPEDLALLTDLAALYEQERRWDDLAAVLDKARQVCEAPAEGALLGHRLARVRLERLQDVPGAIEALQGAVSAAPDLGPARAMLGRLYARRERWTELLALLREELQQPSNSDERRGSLLYRVGDIYERRLAELPAARESYRQALDVAPSFRPALRALSRVLRRCEGWRELVQLYEEEFEATSDRDDQILILRRIAELWERRIGDPEAALTAYERLLAIEPSHLPALQALTKIYALGGRWSDLVAVLRTEADQTMDRWRRITLLTEIAAVQERHLESQEEALATYLEVLGHAPAYQPALMAAGRILSHRGDHEQLLSVHRQELANCEDPQQRCWLLLKIGRLLAEELGRPGEAAPVYQEAMQLDPEGPAADVLLQLSERISTPLELAALRSRLPEADSPRVRALHHRRTAEAFLAGERQELAIEHLRRALAEHPDEATVDHLRRLFGGTSSLHPADRQSMIALQQQLVSRASSDQEALTPLTHLALLWASAEHDLHRAVETYEAILERTPPDRVFFRQLEVLLARLEQWESLAAAINLTSDPSDDHDYRTAGALTTAAIQEHRLGNGDLAAQAAVEVLERAPTNAEALATLERHARGGGHGERLLQVLSRQLRGAQTVAEQGAALCAMAAVHGGRGEVHRALEFFRLATDQLPSFLPAPRGWLRAAREVEAPEEAALAREAEAEATLLPNWRARCHHSAARLWADAGDGDRARQAYERVLEIEPRLREALEELEALLKQARDYPRLAHLYEHQIGNAPPREQRDLLERKAELQRRHLQDLSGARDSISRALELFPEDPKLLSTLAELCRTSKDWRALARVNERLSTLISDHVLLKALHFELGQIWERRLPDLDKAIGQYRRVLELDDTDLDALMRLGDLLFKAKEWPAAAEVLERLARRDDDRGRVKAYHLRLAETYADGLGDLGAAMQCCRRALAMDPGDLEATERLAALLERKGDARSLNAHLQSCLTVHRARLDRDPFTIPSYRALESVFARQEERDHVHVVRSLLCGVGAATRAHFDMVQGERREAPTSPRRPITEDELLRLLLHPMERGPLHTLLSSSTPALRKLHGRAERRQTRPAKVTARARPELAGMIKQISADLGCTKVEAYVVEGGVEQLALDDTSPATLYIGDDTSELSAAELRFRVARLLAAHRLGHALPYRLGPGEFGASVAALLAALCTTFTPPAEEELVDELRSRLDRALGRRLRARLESPALELIDRPFAPSRWLEWMRQSEDRIALAVTGDLVAAIEVLKRDTYRLAPEGGTDLEQLKANAAPRLREFLVFAVSEEALTLRERLGLALRAS